MNHIPRLRFPQFNNAPAWEEKRLGDVCEITNGKANAQDHEDEGIYPLFDRSAIVKKSNKFIFDCESVILPGEGMAFIPKYYNGKFNLHQRAYTLMHFKGCTLYLYYTMLYLQDKLASKAVLSTVMSLRLPIIQNFSIFFPSVAEQQKIAECLHSADAMINAQTQKINTLKTHKKALLQNLFPQEGKTIPRLRFPEFKNAPVWEEKRLGDAGFFTGGGTPSKQIQSYWQGNIPWISSSDLIEGEIRKIQITRKITKNAIQKSATKTIPKNSLLIVSRVGVGKVAVNDIEICTSQDFTNITPIDTNVYFLAYTLTSNSSILLSLNQGTSIKGFVKEDLENLRIKTPNNKEQEKIAECLSSLDTLITKESQKLEHLQSHKKGLMQGLFPLN